MNDEAVCAERDIRALVADLAFQADAGDIEDYLALFTEDAVWEISADNPAGVPAAHCEGHAEIRASVEQRRAMGVQGPGTRTVHHITTLRIDVHGDEAMGHVYYQFVGTVDGRPTIQTLGQYRDGYRQTPAGWRLATRTIIIG